MKRLIKQFLGLACLLACAPLAAQLEPRVVQAPTGASGLALIETARGFELADRLGTRRLLETRPGAGLTTVVEVDGGWIVAGHEPTADGSELVVLQAAADEPIEVAAPAQRFGFRQQPALLVDDDRLVGVAWLEGDGGENNAVLASRLGADGWEPPLTVAPFAGGAQLALRAAVLADGSWLLVWSAVDPAHEDDEILWSRHDGYGWSPPARLHADNEVPDVLPAVVAAGAGAGALVVWSRFDGKDYRLRIARLDGGEWRDTGFAGEEGSAVVGAVPGAAAATFLYSTATPRAWAVLALDETGSEVGRVAIDRAGARSVRPRVLAADATGVTLRFEPLPATELPPGLVSEPPPPNDHRLEWVSVP